MSRPQIVTLCGSTKFKKEFEEANRQLTLENNVVLTCGSFAHADDIKLTELQKARLDILHFYKIRMSDSIYVVNPDGYIGDSTRREILYAAALQKTIDWLEVPAEDSEIMEAINDMAFDYVDMNNL